MAGVFVSYRREDTGDAAGRLVDTLRPRLRRTRIFLDVDTIAPGQDFVEKVREGVTFAHAVLVLIGPHWLAASNPNGRRRLDDPADPIRLEVEEALKRHDKTLIPLVVGNAVMPRASDLPS